MGFCSYSLCHQVGPVNCVNAVINPFSIYAKTKHACNIISLRILFTAGHLTATSRISLSVSRGLLPLNLHRPVEWVAKWIMSSLWDNKTPIRLSAGWKKKNKQSTYIPKRYALKICRYPLSYNLYRMFVVNLVYGVLDRVITSAIIPDSEEYHSCLCYRRPGVLLFSYFVTTWTVVWATASVKRRQAFRQVPEYWMPSSGGALSLSLVYPRTLWRNVMKGSRAQLFARRVGHYQKFLQI